MDLFSDENRRDPYPLYARLRAACPLLQVPPPFDARVIFDYETVKSALSDQETFSSRVPAPKWFIFSDPPVHTRLRGLISKAFTPRMIAGLEGRIRELSRELLDRCAGKPELDLAADYSIPLPMQVIGEMIGIPISEWPLYRRWTDAIMRISYSRNGDEQAERSLLDFRAVTGEMEAYLAQSIEQRRQEPREDLLTRLIEAELDGEKLSTQDILGFFQLLIVGGQETTTNLVNNAVLSLIEFPDQLARLRAAPDLINSAVEEVLRYRSPFQWVMRTPRRDVEVHGQTIPAGKLVLLMIGSANRDPRAFADAERFDIARDPNPHIAFGQGIHFCLGAALARMESRIALGDLLARFHHFELAEPSWEPRQALNVHGPARLALRVISTRAAGIPTSRSTP